MSPTLAGALVTAGLLGVTHAIEPDHVAGISAVTSEYSDSRLSALVGACFSLGHVALVVAWLVGGYLLLGQTEFPAVLDSVGTAGVAVLLGLLGSVMAVRGLQSVLHSHEHDHDGESHAHPHLHLPLLGGHGDGHAGDATHDHDHGVAAYLKTGLVGALFTLSPPVSMIVFASAVVPQYGLGAVALAVLAYTLGITATMSAIGAGVGSVFGVVDDPRAAGALRGVAGVAIVAFGLVVGLDVVPVLG